MQNSVSHNLVTNLQKDMFYSSKLPTPVSFALIPLCHLAEHRSKDFYPGIFLQMWRRDLKNAPSWMHYSAKQEIIRAFHQNVEEGIFTIWIYVTKRGRKIPLYRLTERGHMRLKNFADHMRHFISMAEENERINLESVRKELDEGIKPDSTDSASKPNLEKQ